MARRRKVRRKSPTKSGQSKAARSAYRAKKMRSYGARKKRARRKPSTQPISQRLAYRAKKLAIHAERIAKKPMPKPFIKPQAPAVIAKEVTGISGKLKLIPGLIIGVIIAAYMLLKRK